MNRPTFLNFPAKIEEHRNSGKTLGKCEVCRNGYQIQENFYIVGASSYHLNCLLCAQCLSHLNNSPFFEFENRLYCEHDFKTLFAPICAKCDEFIIGSVIYSNNCSFHSKCLNCHKCDSNLNQNQNGIYQFDGNLYCFDCYRSIDKTPVFKCSKCHQNIDENDLLIHEDQPFHAYHFKCSQENCQKTLEKTAKHFEKNLFCQRCFDLKCDVCFDCKTIIDRFEERPIIALGKHWHIQHFRCSTCLQPFNGDEHFEKNGKAYCRQDFLRLIGNYCFYCRQLFSGSKIEIFGKTFCPDCYRCRGCDQILSHKKKVMELDMLPLCKKCIQNKNFQKVLKIKRKSSE